MAKAVYVTDIHANNYRQFSDNHNRLKDCINVIDDVFRLCTTEGIDTVLFGGDLNDIPKMTYTVVMNALLERFARWFAKAPLVKWYMISGNHDIATKNLWEQPAKTMLKVFAVSFPGKCFIIDNDYELTGDTKHDFVMGIPYYEHKEHFSFALDAAVAQAKIVKEDRDNKITLLIHQTPEGIYNSFIKTETSPHDPRYKIFDMVLDGHIHKKQLLTPTFLVGGNPLHRDLGDIGDEKGIWTLDLSNPAATLKFISRKGKYPEFVRVKADKVTDELKAKHLVIVEPVHKPIENSSAADVKRFSSHLTTKELLTNFWKETEGKDERLLKVGLSFLS